MARSVTFQGPRSVAECACLAQTTFPKTCRCGHDRSNPLVHPEPKYSFGGWLMLMLGATPKPRLAEFTCSRCHQVLGITNDPAVLKEFS